jgi:hypothetical protein
MNTRHSRRISRKAAEQLLDRAAGLDPAYAEAPGGADQLARVLAAAAAPGREHELAGEQMAVAAFEANHLESVASDQRGQMIKSPLAKLLTTKVIAAALTVFAGGGVALAASTGTFSGSGPASYSPGPAVSSPSATVGAPLVAPSVSATASAGASVTASSTGSRSPAGATAGPRRTSSSAAGSSASTVPQTATALCHALISDANGTASQAGQVSALASGAVPKLLTSNSEFSPLAGTAQSAAAVPDYCALLLDLPQLPQPGELAQLPVNVLSARLTQLPAATLTQILTSLPSSTLAAVLTELPTSTVTQLLTELPSTAQTQILNELPTSAVSQLLNELPSSLVSALSGLPGLSNSVSSLLPGL